MRFITAPFLVLGLALPSMGTACGTDAAETATTTAALEAPCGPVSGEGYLALTGRVGTVNIWTGPMTLWTAAGEEASFVLRGDFDVSQFEFTGAAFHHDTPYVATHLAGPLASFTAHGRANVVANELKFEAVNDVEIDDDGGHLHFDLAFDFVARVFRFDVSGIVCPAP